MPYATFTQQDPNEGAPATERTEVRVLFDKSTVYVGIICFDSEPDKIIVNQSRRDADISETDSVIVVFDTFNDTQNAFVFGTNPLGIEYDGQVSGEGQTSGTSQGSSGSRGSQRGTIGSLNLNWDGDWRVRSAITERGWEMEPGDERGHTTEVTVDIPEITASRFRIKLVGVEHRLTRDWVSDRDIAQPAAIAEMKRGSSVSTLQFKRLPRMPAPRTPGGEVHLEPPPEIPRAIPGNILQKLMPVVMIVAMVGMVAFMFMLMRDSGRGINPMMMMMPDPNNPDPNNPDPNNPDPNNPNPNPIDPNAVTFHEALEALCLDRAEVNEHVLATLLGDEAEALRLVEPLHGTGCHCLLLSFRSVSALLLIRPPWSGVVCVSVSCAAPHDRGAVRWRAADRVPPAWRSSSRVP